jgi:response regulator of citrate/malate metabolism
VGAQHVARAEAWLTYLETHARRLYAQILDFSMVAGIALLKRLHELPEQFTARDVSQRGWAGLDRAATERALEVLTEFHYVAPQIITTGGRPKTTYSKNPNLNSPPLTHCPQKG